MLKLIKKLVEYTNGTKFRCYENELAEYIKPQPIPEYILIQTGVIRRNENLPILLNRYEAPLKPESIMVSVQNESLERLHIEIWNHLQDPAEKVFVDNLDRRELPYIFPPTVLFPFNEIRLCPGYDVFNCLILLKPCSILDHWNLKEELESNQ